jgi:prepilin-type N-terminal cleavage/methylation domain-containing protein
MRPDTRAVTPPPSTAGFSLLELIVASTILLVVMLGITRAFTMQHRTYAVVDEVTEAQQNLRAVADLIERDVRRSGFMVPPHAGLCAYDATTAPDTLFVSNTDAIRTVFELEDENEDLTPNKGAPVTGDTGGFQASGSADIINLERLWVDYQPDGADFAVGEGVIVVNRNREDAPVACGTIDAISGTQLTVDFGATGTGTVGLNADVVAVPALKYEVVLGAGGAPNRLERNGQLLASDVEDFQLTFFFDEDDDRVVDANESFGGSGDTAAPWELSPPSNRPDFSSLREVGVNIVTVTRGDDPNVHYQLGAGQVTGNRTAASLPSGDGKRRRFHSARVRLRNSS